MSIRLRVIGTFLLLIVFLIGLALYDNAFIGSIVGDAKMINFAGSERVRAARLAYLARRYADLRIESDRSEIRKEIRNYEEILSGLQNGSERLGLVGTADSESLGYISEAGELWGVYKTNLEGMMEGDEENALKVVDSLVSPLIDRMDRLTFRLDELSTSGISRFKKIKMVILVITVLAGIIIVFDIVLAIVRPMNKLLRGMEKVSGGDLNLRLAEQGNNEFSQLAGSFNHMTESLKESRADLYKINKELEDFVYIVSHDLKEPLRSISAFSQFVNEDYEEKLDDKGRDYLGRITRSSSKMKELIDDLLTLSRVGRTKSRFEEVSTEELVEEALARSRLRMDEKGVQVRIKEGLPVICCDGTKMKEVFANLISNAVKFMDKENPLLEIGWEEEGDGHVFSVKDNGIGIEERYFEKIFEIFQRLNLKEDYEGSGAGLAIVKKVVDEHGGNVWVKSEVGEGSTFHFSIPRTVKS